MNEKKLKTMGTLLVVMLLIGIALATDGNLPGGTSISVDITDPSDGAVKVSPPGNVQLEGIASVGEGVPVANTALIYVIDASGSTTASSGGDCGPDQNPGDPQAAEDEIIDCEIAAAINLNDQAIGLGTVGEVAMTIFAGAPITADATWGGGDVPIIMPGADANTNSIKDVDEVLHSIWVAYLVSEIGRFNEFSVKNIPDIIQTDFAEAAQEACSNAALASSPNKMVVFMSDGEANTGAYVNTVLPCVAEPATVFHTFAVGSGASCNADPNGLGSLQDIADLTGGTCTNVGDPADLPDVLPGIIVGTLKSLELNVDGGSFTTIPSVDIDIPLPAIDPVTATFDHSVPLLPGIHTLCVKATGSDGGGVGSVEDCIDVTIATIDLTPETATNELPTPDHTVTATVAAGADGGVSGVIVNFKVLLGPNMGIIGSDTTVDGEATFTYTAVQGLAGLGTDVIEACFGPDEQGDTVCDTATKIWEDTTSPDCDCLETVNPGGKNVPQAPGTGQNEDGFYELTALDLVDPNPEIFVRDTVSGTVFGPFASGTKIKYSEDQSATPIQKKMGGPNSAIDWHIIGNGDAAVFAVDASGNIAVDVSCLVPPPPK